MHMKIKIPILLLFLVCDSVLAARYDLVYSIQMAAFRSHSARETFVDRYSKLPLYCRKNSRNAYMVYYGVFQSKVDARPHLSEIPDRAVLGAYVVKLDRVRLEPCSNMRDFLDTVY